MQLIPSQNAASSKIAVTSTATLVASLVDTAGSVTNTIQYLRNLKSPANGFIITPENGDIRMGVGITPTAALGTLLSEGVKYFIPNVQIDQVKLIRTGSANVSCSIDFAECNEQDFFAASGGAGGGGDSSASGSTGGATGEYSNAKGDFVATANNGAKTITIAGLPFTLTLEQIIAGGLIQKIDTSGNVTTLDLSNVSVSGSVITLANEADFVTTDKVVVNLEYQNKGFEAGSNLFNFAERRPLDQKYIPELFTLTNVPNATPDETIIIDMDGYRGCTIQVEKTGGTDTFAWTMESSVEGTASTVDFIDTTQYGFTAAHAATAASYTADGIIYANEGFNPRSHKVKIATAGTANDADFQVTIKKFY